MKSRNLLLEAARIRLIEEAIIAIYPTDVVQSPLHLSIGQEAVAIGVCAPLNDNDFVFATYRSHAWFLAKGGDEFAFLSELMGRKTGACKGKGGSMHLASASKGFMGTSALVAGTISHAVGSALALKISSATKSLSVSVFGDGAMDQGSYHESLNFASLNDLAVIFILEDNGYAVHSESKQRQSFNYREHVESYNIEFHEILKAQNPAEISSKMSDVYDLARASNRPQWVRIETYRYKEHVGIHEDFDFGYRTKETFLDWLAKDPINDYIADNYEVIKQIKIEIQQKINLAKSAEFPSPLDLYEDVF